MSNQVNNTQMPDWEQKLIGRKQRWSSLFNGTQQIVRGAAAGAIRGGAFVADAPITYDATNTNAFADPVEVMGQKFYPGMKWNWARNKTKNLVQKNLPKLIGAGANFAAEAIEAPITDQIYAMSADDVLFNISRNDVYLDENKVAELETQTGYHFDSETFNQKLKDTVRQVGDRFDDLTWRTAIMPHILKSMFTEELKKMHKSLAEQAAEQGVISTELLDQTLAKGCACMTDILEDYTTRLANKTEMLLAPIRFTKEKPDPLATAPANLTAEEQKRWKNYTKAANENQATFLTTEGGLRLMRNDALKGFQAKSFADIEQDFNDRYRKAAAGNDGSRPAIDSAEASRAILDVREAKNRYAKRGFFNKIFNWRKARAERQAIARMTNQLKETWPADQVDRALSDRNYVSADSAINAKKIYNLKDASPRQARNQYMADVAGAAAGIVLRGVAGGIAMAATAGTVVIGGTIGAVAGGVKAGYNLVSNLLGGNKEEKKDVPEAKEKKEDPKQIPHEEELEGDEKEDVKASQNRKEELPKPDEDDGLIYEDALDNEEDIQKYNRQLEEEKKRAAENAKAQPVEQPKQEQQGWLSWGAGMVASGWNYMTGGSAPQPEEKKEAPKENDIQLFDDEDIEAIYGERTEQKKENGQINDISVDDLQHRLQPEAPDKKHNPIPKRDVAQPVHPEQQAKPEQLIQKK
ncbi:MAG: hypothetical protein K5696_02575 [Lachnospiraceae bacterium]|nr:hypothetical protein [Lachnospiraceae bacterium]